MPEREDDHLTPATRLLEKRREMAEVEQALAAQKEVSLYITCRQQWTVNKVTLNLGKSSGNDIVVTWFFKSEQVY